MATLVEYLDQSELRDCVSGGRKTPIGYLNTNPNQVLRELLPNFYVVDYLGILIPSKNENPRKNNGLKISQIPDGIGIIGNIEMLNKNSLFNSCQHEPFSKTKNQEIFEKIKSRLRPIYAYQNPIYHSEAEKYTLIFEILGHPISVDELVRLTNPNI